MGTTVEDVVIVGGGIAGLATAVALKRAGVEALVLERSEGLRATGAALTLFPNAWFALDALGVSPKLASYTSSFKNYVTDLETGKVQVVSLSKTNGDADGPRSVHRKALLEALAGELPILIGYDGVHSVVSRWLGLREPVHSGRSAARALAVYPQGHGLEQDVRQYTGTGRRAGFVPLNDKEIYRFFTGTSPAKGTSLAEDPEEIQKEILENYAKDLPHIYLDVVRHTDLSTLTWAPLMFRYPWNVVFGNLSKHNITVAGDAMHPMTPDLAQGGCSALEDAVILQNGHVLRPKEVSEVLSKYVEERRWRVAFLIMGSYIAGWVQQGGSGWGRKFLRDTIFYKFFVLKMVTFVNYDSGNLDF